MEKKETTEQDLELSSTSSCRSSCCSCSSSSDSDTEKGAEGHTCAEQLTKEEDAAKTALILDREVPPPPIVTKKCFSKIRSPHPPAPEDDKDSGRNADDEECKGPRGRKPDLKTHAIQVSIDHLPPGKKKMRIECSTVSHSHPRPFTPAPPSYGRTPSAMSSSQSQARPTTPVMTHKDSHFPPAPAPGLPNDYHPPLPLNNFNKPVVERVQKNVKRAEESEDQCLENVRRGEDGNTCYNRFRSPLYRPRYRNYRPCPYDGPPNPSPARRCRGGGGAGRGAYSGRINSNNVS